MEETTAGFRHLVRPDRETFRARAREGNVVPVYRELLADVETPVSAYMKVARGPHSFLLESVEGGERWARYSFIGCDPGMVIEGKGKSVAIRTAAGRERFRFQRDPLEVVEAVMARYKVVEDSSLPRFSGGLVGALGYDLSHRFERVRERKKPAPDVPGLILMRADNLIVFDNVTHTMKIVANAFVEGDADRAYDDAVARIHRFSLRLAKALPRRRARPPAPTGRAEGVRSNMTREEYRAMVLRAKEYIRAGDIFQVVPSQRFEKETAADPLDIYRALRVINPSPYMYFLHAGKTTIAGSSPEILVRLEDGKVTLRPIAGTRPRGKTREEDAALERELLADPKERAEHVMLVDLGRNDVGRVAETGSVTVSDFMTVERYSHVMHIVSNVEGRLTPGRTAADVLRATFPAGTVSGAPKIRAMEIIEELEPTRRGFYAGAVGYFGFSGNMDMAIAIRTAVCREQPSRVEGRRPKAERTTSVFVQAGGGIVADSDPDAEFAETENKAKAVLRALETAERGLG
ncbi:MAG: anthranilate synthase component I [Nitrospirae bacterium RBG_16_64_22]|nr:MAG: anthranilate synthase component I [Nitrospirae bacterium RBG_16_64_22]